VSGLLRQLQRNKGKTQQEERGAVLRSSISQGAMEVGDESEEPITVTPEVSYHREPSWVRALTEELSDASTEKPKRPPTLHNSLKTEKAEFQSAPWWLKDGGEQNPQVDSLAAVAVESILSKGKLPTHRADWKPLIETAISGASEELKDEVRLSRRLLEQVEHVLLELVSGKGPLEPLFQDALVSEIFVDHHEFVRVIRSGHAIETPLRFFSKDAYEIFIRSLLAHSNREISESCPVVDLVLDDKWQTRVNIVHPIIAGGDEPKICFRVPRYQAISFFDILQTKTLPATLAAWLAELVALGEANILVTGMEQSGKTVFTTALLSAVGSDERIIAIEKFPEIFVPNGHFERLVSHRQGERGEFLDGNELLSLALRRAPHRLVMTLLDANTSADFLDALETGLSGSIASILGADAIDALWRLADYVAGTQMRTPVETIVRRLSRSIQLVITTRRDETGPCLYQVAEVLPSLETEFRLLPLVEYVGIASGKRHWQLKVRQSYWLSKLKEQGLHLVPGPGLLGPDDSIEQKRTSGNIVG